MNRFATASAVLLASTAIAQAGGLDRSGLGISALFEEGNYFELSFGQVMPTVTGTDPDNGDAESGNVAADYLNYGLAVKTDLTDEFSIMVSFEQAFGADVDYTRADAGYLVPTFTGDLDGTALTAIGRYRLDGGFSVYAGLRYVTMAGEIVFEDSPAPTVDSVFTYDPSSDLGYLIGVSYEIPDIALRASLTYNSATRHNNDISLTVGGAPQASAPETGAYTLPQSINLDFQTGVAEGTLLLASIRWAEWTVTELNTQTPLGVIDYDNDVYTYTLGVARRFSEDFAGLVRLSYEQANGGLASNLSPTDGLFGVSLAGIYTIDNVDITAGVNFTHVGDTTTEAPVEAEFDDNYVIGAGVRIGVSF